MRKNNAWLVGAFFIGYVNLIIVQRIDGKILVVQLKENLIRGTTILNQQIVNTFNK
jgi:hypothetical protein